MIDRNDLLTALNNIAPESIQESWDNCGLQIDVGRQAYNKILVCLEITRDVINEAIEKGAEIIVTHHPLYFRETKNVLRGTIPGDYTIDLIKHDIAVYSSHTCFDKVNGGNNTELCRMLGLENVEKMYEGPGENDYVGYMGIIPDVWSVNELAVRVKDALGLDDGEVRYTGDMYSFIMKIAVCTGSGADLLMLAKSYGCDALVTGDVKYHDAQTAKELGIALVDAGHYGTEIQFAENMAEKLRTQIGMQAEVIVSETNINPFSII